MIKIKEWIKNHKKELIIASVSVAAGSIGGIALYKHLKVGDLKNINVRFYNDVFPAAYGSNCSLVRICYKEEGKTLKDCAGMIDDLTKADFYDPDREVTGMAIFTKK